MVALLAAGEPAKLGWKMVQDHLSFSVIALVVVAFLGFVLLTIVIAGRGKCDA